MSLWVWCVTRKLSFLYRQRVFCHLLLGFCRPHADWTITYKLPHICALSSVKDTIGERVFIVHKCDWDDCESTIYWKKDTEGALLDWTQWTGGCWVILSLIQELVTDSRSGGTISIPVKHTHTHTNAWGYDNAINHQDKVHSWMKMHSQFPLCFSMASFHSVRSYKENSRIVWLCGRKNHY